MEILVRLAILVLVGTAVAVARSAWIRYINASGSPSIFDLADADAAGAGVLIGFTSPYCYECQVALPVLHEAAKSHGMPLAVIDARDRPDLTSKYDIRSTPTILAVDPDGRVRKSWRYAPSREELDLVLASI